MKVVVAHNLYSSAQPSGENSVVHAEIQALREAGVRVLPYMRSSDEIAKMSLRRRSALPISPIYARQAQRELAEILVAQRPDVLHLHNPYPLLSPWVVKTAHRLGVPVVQTVHNFRHECVAGVFFRQGAPCHECQGLRWPLPALRHRCYRGSLPQTALMVTTLAVHRGTWLGVDRFIALAPMVADFLRRFGAAEHQIALRPNPVADPGPPAPLGEGFLFAGRLAPEKGVTLLLDAWRRHADGARGVLTIAGDGPLRSQVETLAAQRSDVRYLGLLDRAALDSAMRATAVVVIASTGDDVLPTIGIEALAHARPILATARGGLPWLVGVGEPRPGGWVVEPVADRLAEALAGAKAGAAKLSPQARTRYERQFAPNVLLERLLAIYGDVRAARSA